MHLVESSRCIGLYQLSGGGSPNHQQLGESKRNRYRLSISSRSVAMGSRIKGWHDYCCMSSMSYLIYVCSQNACSVVQRKCVCPEFYIIMYRVCYMYMVDVFYNTRIR